MEELSPKEVLLSVTIIIMVIALSVFINPFIKDSFLDDIRMYQNALQIDGDTAQFQYAKNTSVGDVFAYGRMKSTHPVILPELIGQYSIIEKVTERYTQHTREVCNGYDEDGECTGYRTEIYYSWDTHSRNGFISDYFEFLSVSFSCTSLDISTQGVLGLSQNTVSQSFISKVQGNYIYEENGFWTSEGDLRYYYNVLPYEFSASVFTNFNTNGNVRAKVYYEKNREQVLSDKESSIRTFDFVYYVMWILVIGGGYYYWAYNHGEIE